MQMSLHQEHAITPRSILRHRPIGDGRTTLTSLPKVPERASRTQSMKQSVIPDAALPITETGEQSVGEQGTSLHWLGFVGLGMCAMVLVVICATLVVRWGEQAWLNWQYGYPRTYQVDTFVGHEQGHTASHFVAMNLHGQIEIIELPGGDMGRAHLYLGPQLSGPGADQVPVTLQFVANKDDAQHPNMIVHIGSTQVFYHNIHGSFQSP